MKNFVIGKKDYAPLALLLTSATLMVISVLLKSMLVIAGVTGLVIAWFLCIDKLIAASKISLVYRVILATIVVGLPVAITAYMG
ncbi:MAG TPA: hypothetical protein VHB48_19970 [Chitinophagaceae bacterium]|nr:hypothetical protein [Chitinophagaceae bacterium]